MDPWKKLFPPNTEKSSLLCVWGSSASHVDEEPWPKENPPHPHTLPLLLLMLLQPHKSVVIKHWVLDVKEQATYTGYPYPC